MRSRRAASANEAGEVAVDRFGRGLVVGRTQIVDVLGQHGQVDPGSGRPFEQLVGGGEVGRPVVARVDLAHGDSHDTKTLTARGPAATSDRGEDEGRRGQAETGDLHRTDTLLVDREREQDGADRIQRRDRGDHAEQAVGQREQVEPIGGDVPNAGHHDPARDRANGRQRHAGHRQGDEPEPHRRDPAVLDFYIPQKRPF